MRCKPKSRHAPHSKSVLKPERVKAKPPSRRGQSRGLDPNTVCASPRPRTANSRRLKKEARAPPGLAHAHARGPECASRQKTLTTWRPIFFIRPQALEASSKNALPYDDWSSGSIIYAYVGGNPISGIDPCGLFDITNPADWPTIPQGVVNACAGFGDGVSLGATTGIRGLMGTNDAVLVAGVSGWSCGWCRSDDEGLCDWRRAEHRSELQNRAVGQPHWPSNRPISALSPQGRAGCERQYPGGPRHRSSSPMGQEVDRPMRL